MLTHDPEQAAAYDADPLIFRQIAIRFLLDLHDAGTRLIGDAAAITAPTLLLASGNDWVVKVSAQRQFFERLGSKVKQMEVYAGQFHALLQEKERPRIVERIRGFLQGCFTEPWQSDGLLYADKGSFTRTEYDLLRTRGSLKWPIVRAGMKAGGWLSHGVRLGWRTGFDSGATLDYIYCNKARGITPLGTLIDRSYLNAIGWRGIRVRRQNLQQLLRRAIRDLRDSGRPIHILDVASGPGRYILETLREFPELPISATLRDYQQSNLDAARRLADQLQLRNVAVALGDAFDRASLGAITPRPTIAITSGIFELFPDNAPVLECLRGIADAMEPGGFLIYTCQPWHPQIEMIARTLTNREGKPWVMRRRSQAEMDALVRSAGFEKTQQEIDSWGIFTVALARRVEGNA
jgi:SAM-dependent methyltransferase